MMAGQPDMVLIDARDDDQPSGSRIGDDSDVLV
jgi:hypothetical protein